VSVAPTVTEASDLLHRRCICLTVRSQTMGYQVTFEAPPVGSLIRHLLAGGKTLRDGDRIIGNDPFVGALHQNDLQMCAPLFVDGELVAWAGVMPTRQTWAAWTLRPGRPRPRRYGKKVCASLRQARRCGELREDVLEMILTATRLPAQVGLDIRAFIATLNRSRGPAR